MGQGANRNKLCKCGSGKKVKNCNCKFSRIKQLFPDEGIFNEDGTMFHVMAMVSNADYPGFDQLDSEKKWYAPLCNQEQISRIFNPQNGWDLVLKEQVNSVLDNMRVQRVFYDKYNRTDKWDIEEHFDRTAFNTFFLFIQDKPEFNACKNIPCGMTYDSDPNGQCIKKEFGDIITISANLQEFLYYMNLFYLGIFDKEIPDEVALYAQVLGIRIMLQTEALDFDIDPRGQVPRRIDFELKNATLWQLIFVVAHEFSHSLLEHLDDNNLISCCVNNKSTNLVYNQSQKQEFEADINAIKLVNGSIKTSDIIGVAINFFLFMDLYEQAKEQIYPSATNYKTHPKAADRIKNILEYYKEDANEYDVDNLLNINEELKKALMEHISINMDGYEKYGSVYLDEWHKKDLKDRIDY